MSVSSRKRRSAGGSNGKRVDFDALEPFFHYSSKENIFYTNSNPKAKP